MTIKRVETLFFVIKKKVSSKITMEGLKEKYILSAYLRFWGSANFVLLL